MFNQRMGHYPSAQNPNLKMKANVSYSLILNKVQTDYLAACKYGINRMQALVSIIDLAQTEEETYEIRGLFCHPQTRPVGRVRGGTVPSLEMRPQDSFQSPGPDEPGGAYLNRPDEPDECSQPPLRWLMGYR
jgi:hypothetical protein